MESCDKGEGRARAVHEYTLPHGGIEEGQACL
jgi:hypothetical protein